MLAKSNLKGRPLRSVSSANNMAKSQTWAISRFESISRSEMDRVGLEHLALGPKRGRADRYLQRNGVREGEDDLSRKHNPHPQAQCVLAFQ